MRLFKRLQATVVTNFDSLITKTENHAAIIEAAIRETRGASAKARVHLHRVRRDAQSMRERISELEQEEETWRRRAIESPESDQERALECLRRRRRAQREREHLTQEVANQEALERQISADLGNVTARIAELERRRNALAARESRTRAVEASGLDTQGIIDDLDQIFGRWEGKLADRESYVACDHDTFQAEFVLEEEDRDLRDELAALRSDAAETDNT